jgi:hypothetical protein
MKPATWLLLSLLLVQNGYAQQKSKSHQTIQKSQHMITEQLKHPVVKSAIEALQQGDLQAWDTLFSNDAALFDDGRKIDLHSFSKDALGHERFTAIDKVENDGLDIYGKFHSDKWGDFKTYFKFHINAEHKISKLEIGQANY